MITFIVITLCLVWMCFGIQLMYTELKYPERTENLIRQHDLRRRQAFEKHIMEIVRRNK